MCTSTNWIPQFLTIKQQGEAQINTGLHHFTKICHIFQDKCSSKNVPIKSCNLENGLDKFYFSNLLALDTLSYLIRGAWNRPISCLNYSESQERGLWEFKSRKLLGGASFRKFLEAFAFGAHLGNWSIFILDFSFVNFSIPRLIVQAKLKQKRSFPFSNSAAKSPVFLAFTVNYQSPFSPEHKECV